MNYWVLYSIETAAMMFLFCSGRKSAFIRKVRCRKIDRIFHLITGCSLTPALSILLGFNLIAAVGALLRGDRRFFISFALALLLTRVWRKISEVLK